MLAQTFNIKHQKHTLKQRLVINVIIPCNCLILVHLYQASHRWKYNAKTELNISCKHKFLPKEILEKSLLGMNKTILHSYVHIKLAYRE